MKYVDLGLLSGTLWADRNVGADYPHEHGIYLNFNDTQNYGTIPTIQQIQELIVCTIRTVCIIGNIKGMTLTGVNDNSIFMPFAGFLNYDSGLCHVGSSGGYWWSCVLSDGGACYLFLGNNGEIFPSVTNYLMDSRSVRLIKNK